jgi:Tfp pilus assembly protein PilF
LGDLLEMHTADDPKADARKHWDAMRGGVKVQLASEKFAAGRLEEAGKTVEEAIATAPDNAEAYVLAARIELESGDLAKAKEALAIAETLPGPRAELHYLAGVVAERGGDLDGALLRYSAASSEDPQNPDYLLAEAETLVTLDRHVEAAELLASRASDFDGCAPLHMLTARLSQMLGLRGPAVVACREVLRLCEDDPRSAAEVGQVLAWAGHHEEAIGVLQPLAAADSTTPAENSREDALTPDALHALAKAYFETHRWQQARHILKRIMRQDQRDVVAWCLFARAALMERDREAAAEAMRTVNANVSPTADTLLLAAHIALEQGDLAGAMELAGRAIAEDERSVAAHCLLGHVFERAGRFDEARRAYAVALTIDPDSSTVRRLLSRVSGDPAHVLRKLNDAPVRAGVVANRSCKIVPVRSEEP